MNLNDWRVQLDMKEHLNCILIREGVLEIYQTIAADLLNHRSKFIKP